MRFPYSLWEGVGGRAVPDGPVSRDFVSPPEHRRRTAEARQLPDAGAAGVGLGAVLHIIALDLINHQVREVVARHAVPLHARIRIPLLVFATLATFLSHVAQIWLWAVFYLLVGEFDELEPALYFSTVVFTTLGFGDILSSADWRLMASCEAAGRLLLFGLSTAFLFEVMREILSRRRP